MRSTGWNLGPLKIQTRLFLNDAGYDSNIYYGSANQIKDYTFTVGPGFNIFLPLKKKIVLQIYESPQYAYYLETRKERTWNNYFNGQVHFVLNRFFVSVGQGYSTARQRWNTEIDIKLRRKEDSLQGSVLWQATKKTSFSLRYRRSRYDYENLAFETFNIRDRLNRTENYLNFTSYYQLSYKIRYFLDAEYGVFNFQTVARSKDSRSYGIYGGFEFSPLGKISGRINLGYKRFDILDPSIRDYRGIVGDTQLSIRLLRYLVARASFERNAQFSIWYDNAYYLENVAGVGASFYVSRNIRLDYNFHSGRNRYNQTQLIAPGSLEKRSDDYIIHSAGIYFRLKKSVGLGITASRWSRHSNLPWETGNRDFLGMSLTYDF